MISGAVYNDERYNKYEIRASRAVYHDERYNKYKWSSI